MIQESKSIYIQLLEKPRKNQPCILSTVTNFQSFAPQKPGCPAIFGKNKLLAATVGSCAIKHAIGEIAINIAAQLIQVRKEIKKG